MFVLLPGDYQTLIFISNTVNNTCTWLCSLKIWCTVKPVYNGQPQGITKVVFVERWPLLTIVAYVRSDGNSVSYPIFTGRIKTGLCGQETTTRRCPYAQVWHKTLKHNIFQCQFCILIALWNLTIYKLGELVSKDLWMNITNKTCKLHCSVLLSEPALYIFWTCKPEFSFPSFNTE